MLSYVALPERRYGKALCRKPAPNWTALFGATITNFLQEKKIEIKTDDAKMSYALGINMGAQVSQLPLDVDVDATTIAEARTSLLEALLGRNPKKSDFAGGKA